MRGKEDKEFLTNNKYAKYTQKYRLLLRKYRGLLRVYNYNSGYLHNTD